MLANLDDQLGGTHAGCASRHLQSYLDVFAYRYNHRDNLQDGFEQALGFLISSKPVRWGELVGGVN